MLLISSLSFRITRFRFLEDWSNPFSRSDIEAQYSLSAFTKQCLYKHVFKNNYSYHTRFFLRNKHVFRAFSLSLACMFQIRFQASKNAKIKSGLLEAFLSLFSWPAANWDDAAQIVLSLVAELCKYSFKCCYQGSVGAKRIDGERLFCVFLARNTDSFGAYWWYFEVY